ncbi:MAG TPA: O-antigen ligase family protein [Thermoleophilaceae bacterium]
MPGLAASPAAAATAPKGLAVVAATLAVAGAFVLPGARRRALAALAALALAPALVLAELWDSTQVESLRDAPAKAAAAAVGAAVVVAVLAAVLRRRPGLLPLLAVLALPIRLPVETGSTSANLLVPLYAVVAAGVLAYALERLRPDGADREDGAWRERPPGPVELALLGFVALYAVQSLYSTDFEQAVKNVAFFYVPFALLLKLLTTVRWSAGLVRRCFAVAGAMAVVFVAIGFWEYATRELLWNRKVIESNQFESYFRVNSLFFDPNIYGRFLAIVMIGLAAVLLWARGARAVAVAALTLGWLWAGLVLTFSQSSFAALLVGLAALAALRWGPRRVGTVLAVAALAAVVVGLALKGPLGVESDELDRTSGNRRELVEAGLSMVADRPLWGYGSGSFAERFREREEASSQRAASASHTIPVTVAAEQGVVGLVAFAALVALALRTLFGGLAPLSGRDPPPRLATRAFLAAAFAALAFHTLLYAAFLEDPIAWTLVAVGLVLQRRVEPDAAPSDAGASSARARTATSTP